MSEPQIVAAQSLEHFEKVVDSWMQREPFKSMDRSEARRVIAGIPLLMAQRGPVDPENPRKIELSQTDLEEAKRLCDEAEA